MRLFQFIFDFFLKRHWVIFYLLGCITKLKYTLFRPALKYNLFTRYVNYYIKEFLHFLHLVYKNKKLLRIYDIGINKILVSQREPYGQNNSFKYFIGYDDNDDIRPSCMRLTQLIGYAKYFDSNKTMSFKVVDQGLLKKHTKIWGELMV